MYMEYRLAGAGRLALVAMLTTVVGCDRGAVDDDSTGGDGIVPVELESVEPGDGTDDFYYRGNLRVTFEGLVEGLEITLEQAGGDVVTGTLDTEEQPGDEPFLKAVFDPFGDDPEQHLAPQTDYTATLSWANHLPVEVAFRTSGAGAQVADPQVELVGGDYFIDMTAATFSDPEGMDVLLTENLAALNAVLHVESISGNELQAVVGFVHDEQGGWVQDLCQPTHAFTSEQGDPGPGLFTNPYLHIGPQDLPISLDGYRSQVLGLEIGGSFTADGAEIVGGTWDGFMPMPDIEADPPADEDEQCDILEALGLECVDCPDGSFPCLEVSAHDFEAARVPVSGVNPETGELYETLVEVTEQMADDWDAGGYCTD